jgi:hypothetical protein
MTTDIEFKAWLCSPLTKALMQSHKEAMMMRFENTRIDKAVKAEREACAKICDDMVLYTGYDCATAIRARGED